MILNKIFQNINLTKSLFILIFFTKTKISHAIATVEDILKKNNITPEDIKNFYNFEENFDEKDYGKFIFEIERKFSIKFNSSYWYTQMRRKENMIDEFNYYYRRLAGNIINLLTTDHPIIKNNIENIRFESSRISPFKVKEYGLDLLDQRLKHFPIYLSDIYLKAKLQLNNTGFKNFFFQKFYNASIKEKVLTYYHLKKDAINSISNWWLTTNDGYYTDYKILLIFIFSSFFISFAIFIVSNLVGNSTSIFFERAKTSVYECGFQPFERIDKCQIFVFYRLSIFFIIFEAELIFLFPWAINVCEMSIYSISFFYNASFFIFILFYGFIYEIKNKALDI